MTSFIWLVIIGIENQSSFIKWKIAEIKIKLSTSKGSRKKVFLLARPLSPHPFLVARQLEISFLRLLTQALFQPLAMWYQMPQTRCSIKAPPPQRYQISWCVKWVFEELTRMDATNLQPLVLFYPGKNYIPSPSVWRK